MDGGALEDLAQEAVVSGRGGVRHDGTVGRLDRRRGLIGQGLHRGADALGGRLDAHLLQPTRRIGAVGLQQRFDLARRLPGELRGPERVGEREVAFDIDEGGDAIGVEVGMPVRSFAMAAWVG